MLKLALFIVQTLFLLHRNHCCYFLKFLRAAVDEQTVDIIAFHQFISNLDLSYSLNKF